MSLEKMRHEIIDTARKSAKQVRQQAEAERDAILEQVEQQAKSMIESAKSDATELNRVAELKSLSGVELGAKNEVLRAIEQLTSHEAESIAKQLIKQMRKSKAYPLLFRRVFNLSKALGEPNELNVLVNKEDRQLAAKAGFKNIDVGNINGLVVHTKDKKISIDATLENLVAQQHQLIRSAVRKELMRKVAPERTQRKSTTKPNKPVSHKKKSARKMRTQKTVRGKKKR